MNIHRLGDVEVVTIHENKQSYPNIAAMYKIHTLCLDATAMIGGDGRYIQIILRDSSIPSERAKPTIINTCHEWANYQHGDSIYALTKERDGSIIVVFFNCRSEHMECVLNRRSQIRGLKG